MLLTANFPFAAREKYPTRVRHNPTGCIIPTSEYSVRAIEFSAYGDRDIRRWFRTVYKVKSLSVGCNKDLAFLSTLLHAPNVLFSTIIYFPSFNYCAHAKWGKIIKGQIAVALETGLCAQLAGAAENGHNFPHQSSTLRAKQADNFIGMQPMSPRMGMIVYAHTQEVRSGGFSTAHCVCEGV